jgi:hypothetical protein
MADRGELWKGGPLDLPNALSHATSVQAALPTPSLDLFSICRRFEISISVASSGFWWLLVHSSLLGNQLNHANWSVRPTDHTDFHTGFGLVLDLEIRFRSFQVIRSSRR